jgi:hypothetical protein
VAELLTIEQCAAKAQVSPRTLKREILAGKLKAVEEYGRWVIRPEDWENYLTSCRVKIMPAPERKRVIEYAVLPDNPAQEALLTAESIRSNRAPFPQSGPAVYFLWKGDELQYIGQAVNLYARVAYHLRDKEFDGFSYISCKLEELDELERRAILMWQPRLNKRFVYLQE